MANTKRAKIVATGSYLPKKILTNKDLEKMVNTSDEWIITRTGIQERHLADENECTSDMGVEAAKQAIARAGISPLEIDLIIVPTCTPDYLFPSTSALIQRALQAHNAATFDLQAACTGYLYALSIAKAYIESGIYKNILIVASDKMSSIVDYEDRNTCVLFGDGASAAIVSGEGAGLIIKDVCLGTDGEEAELLILPGGGSKNPSTIDSVQNKMHFLKMEGRVVYRHAVRLMEMAVKHTMERVGLTSEDVDWLVPHQANIRIISAIAKRFNVPMEQVYKTVHKYGNTSASGVAIALDELMNQNILKTDQNILLVAFGSGFTWGASVLTKD